MSEKIKVTVWNEGRHEKSDKAAHDMYPNGIHGTVKEFLDKNDDLEVRAVTLDDPEQGLPDSLLYDTDVLMWWGHMSHHEVKDELVEKIKNRVYNEGMGFIGMHSAHMSKPFRAIVGTSGQLSWGDEQQEILWNLLPQHPIAAGVPEYFELPTEEMYGEPFRIPQPDELLFTSWFKGGNIFRSGLCYYRGIGKIFYFQPGHETCASFHNPNVQRILTNAVRWAKPNEFAIKRPTDCPHRYNPLYELEQGQIQMKR